MRHDEVARFYYEKKSKHKSYLERNSNIPKYQTTNNGQRLTIPDLFDLDHQCILSLTGFI